MLEWLIMAGYIVLDVTGESLHCLCSSIDINILLYCHLLSYSVRVAPYSSLSKILGWDFDLEALALMPFYEAFPAMRLAGYI